MNVNIPNLVSLLRIVLIPLFIYLMFIPTMASRIWALVVFIIASLTDILDGWSARKLQQETDVGKFLDPMADKFLVISAMISFLFLDPLIPLWMILIIIARDLLITLMRYLAIRQGTELRTSKFGKVKTAFQMVSIILIIMVFIVRGKGVDISHYVAADQYLKINAVYEIYLSQHPQRWLIIGPFLLMAFVTLLTALSGLRYIVTNWRLFLPPYRKEPVKE
jgi:cardiolipin synthase